MIKVLVSSQHDGNASQYSLGILNALNETGQQAAFWNRPAKPAFDAFNEFQPDVVFVESVTLLDRALVKCIIANKAKLVIGLEEYMSSDLDQFASLLMLVPDEKKVTFVKVHGPEVPDTFSRWNETPIFLPYALDTTNYEQGKHIPELACEVAYVGGYDQSRVELNKTILGLANPLDKCSIKVFGNKPWPMPQFLGYINVEDVRNLYSSATTTLHFPANPNIIHEKVYQVLGSGGVLVVMKYDNRKILDVLGPAVVRVDDERELIKLVRAYNNNPKSRAKQVAFNLEYAAANTYKVRVNRLYDKLHINVKS